jgi:hypothetical protein
MASIGFEWQNFLNANCVKVFEKLDGNWQNWAFLLENSLGLEAIAERETNNGGRTGS